MGNLLCLGLEFSVMKSSGAFQLNSTALGAYINSNLQDWFRTAGGRIWGMCSRCSTILGLLCVSIPDTTLKNPERHAVRVGGLRNPKMAASIPESGKFGSSGSYSCSHCPPPLPTTTMTMTTRFLKNTF